MNDTLSVTAIKNGTVIDHIAQGQATRLMHLLSLKKDKNQITIGLQLPSKRIGAKDLIKIENRVLSEDEANEIVVFAPDATINVIENYVVVKKIKTHLPEAMKDIFICPNPVCITQQETVESHFYIQQFGRSIQLLCHYCDRTYDRDVVKLKIYS